MRSNKLSLYFTKTEFLLITKAKRQKSFEIKINGHAIQPSSYAKYLDVYIDDKLTWKKHVNTVCPKIGKGCWALARLRNYANQKTLLKAGMWKRLFSNRFRFHLHRFRFRFHRFRFHHFYQNLS